jgi:serine/threonine protein kinase
VNIDGYRVIRMLSQGGFGSVYYAERATDNFGVAIKVLRDPNDETHRRFVREAMHLQREQANAHVVTILDCRFDSDPAYIVMEYCAGGSLRSWVGAPRGWRDVVSALVHAALGLSGIHARGGFHRDVKPDNLLIALAHDGQKVVKLADFGLARAPQSNASSPMTRSPWGTFGYMAPELSFGVAFDSSCDVYSLGITGIELLTGSRTPASLTARHDLPTTLADLLRRMTDPDPAQRPGLAAIRRSLTDVAAAADVRAPQRLRGNWALAMLAAAGVAWATMNSRDANGRWHGTDGRFRPGPWG